MTAKVDDVVNKISGVLSAFPNVTYKTREHVNGAVSYKCYIGEMLIVDMFFNPYGEEYSLRQTVPLGLAGDNKKTAMKITNMIDNEVYR